MFTWDEAKRRANLTKHGLDFVGAEAIFDGPVMTEDDTRLDYGEQRINLIGLLHGAVVFMTYTERGDDLHLISLRPATRHETRQFAYRVSRHR